MAHLSIPPGGDPEMAAWIRLPRQRRRAARAATRRALRFATRGEVIPSLPESEAWDALTKAERRAATPWHGIVLPPGDQHFLSGHSNADKAALILLGLNRRERRAMRGKSGPRGRNLIGSGLSAVQAGHVVRSDRRILPVLNRFGLFHRADGARRRLADAQDFQTSWKGRALRGLATAAAVPIVAGRRLKDLGKRLIGGNGE